MSLRLIAIAIAFVLVVGVTAADKKKLDYAPETGPEPRPVVAPPATTLPTPHYLESHPPQYFPEEPSATGKWIGGNQEGSAMAGTRGMTP